MSLTELIDNLPSSLHLKARSLLVTVWGDSVAPHGGTVWLGSLIDLVKDLGLNERVVRTSVFRLKQDQLLDSHQIGRKSYYTLTRTGEHRFEEATKRIYRLAGPTWDESWTLVFTERRALSDEKRKQLQVELGWQGFGDLGSGIFAHPGGELSALQQLLKDLEIENHVAVLKATNLSAFKETPLKVLVQKGWDIGKIEEGYKEFIRNFTPILKGLSAHPQLNAKNCFIVRTLLVHDYRRALLKDPLLPEVLLPTGWSGNEARLLFKDLYLAVWEKAEEHLLKTLETNTGKLPEASEEFLTRFEGLRKTT
ncbi:phenylacetic acid degradation operon negative regulatory protein PaaX [Sneathiella sp.]|uniref:phenylacetic acid degradation operon negative regulatory protein PaaX n=1 Tax=Sneathiella sp. TaxID=1964365 RepID=UPI0039E53277